MKEGVAVIWNPASGRARPGRLETVLGRLEERGFRPELFRTEGPGDAAKLSSLAAEKGFGKFLVCGGDGTINEAVQPLAFTDAGVGILPMGTVNVLARELGIPLSFARALERFCEGKERRVSLGKAVFHRGGGTRYFLLMAGIGFDAEVIRQNSLEVKYKIGRLSYLRTAWKLLFNHQGEKLKFTVDREEITGFNAVVGKSSRYGGNFRVTGSANLFEPELHAVILKDDDPLDILKLGWYSLVGSPPCFAGAEFRITGRVEVEGKAPVQLDGELAGEAPCHLESAENCLSVVF